MLPEKSEFAFSLVVDQAIRLHRGVLSRIMSEYLLIAVCGLAVGLIGGYGGIGGAPLLVFLLGTLLGYPQHLAQGTVIAVMLGPMSLPGVWVMWDRVKPLSTLVAVAVVTYACFSYFGASIAYLFSSEVLRLLFSGLLLAIGLRYLLFRNGRRARPAQKRGGRSLLPLNVWTMALLGAGIGVVGGLFGIGAGVVLVPLLVKLFGMDKDDARAVSLAMLVPPVSIGAVIKYQTQGDIHWYAVLVALTAYFASNYWGAKLGRRETGDRFRLWMGVILFVSGLLYMWMSLRASGTL